MPLSNEDLDYFKNLLIRKRDEALSDLGELESSSRDKDAKGSTEDRSTYSLHMADHGTDAMEREKNMLLAQRNRDYVDQIDAALERIENGTYGICRITGADIARPRLEAVPTATLSIEGKMQLEQAKE